MISSVKSKCMEDYIKYIRNLIGHKEIMAIAVCGLILNEKDEVLLEKRSDNLKLSFPGGALNMGENILNGLKREIKEETGIDLDKINSEIDFYGIYSGEKGKFIYPNGDITFYTDIVFKIIIDSRTLKIKEHDNESLEIKFYKFDDINLDNLVTFDKEVLLDYYVNKIDKNVIR